jgi:ankyrin repeat protein
MDGNSAKDHLSGAPIDISVGPNLESVKSWTLIKLGPPDATDPGAARMGQVEPMQDADAGIVELATRLFAMAREGATTSLEAYLDAGIPPDLANQSGDTLTMLAAYHGQADTVRALLGHGADPDQANDRGQTPLAGAVFKDEAEVIRILVEGGADPQAGHPSAFETATIFHRPDLLEMLRGH